MSTPICRCRVLYLGSSVPHVTKDGLHGIQEPLRELYPEDGVSGAKGIDSWLSVWSNGLLLENVDEKRKRVTRFFPIDSLHYCAAVRHVTIPGVQPEAAAINSEVGGSSPAATVHQRFLPLDSPFARIPSPNNPPLFACILRRTSGIKVLECHAFVCKKEMAANALVRCCFHAYADNTFVKQLETGNNIYGVVNNNHNNSNGAATEGGQLAAVNPIQKVEQWRAYVPSTSSSKDDLDGHLGDNSELVSIYDSNENHKVWSGGPNGNVNGQNTSSGHQNDADNERNSIYGDYISTTLRSSVKSTNGTLQNGHKSNGRPRQLTTPSSPPPPPPPTQILTETETRTKGKKIPKKYPQSKHLGQNGNGVNGGGQLRWHPSSEFRPMWPSPPFMSPPPPLMQNGGMYPPPPPHSGPMMPILMAPGHPPPPPPTPGGRMSKNGPQRQKNVMDEPIYVPVTGRQFKNGGSQLYHPSGFPYAEDPNSYYLMGPGPMSIPPPAPGTPIGGGSSSRTPTPTKYKKKKDKKSNSDSETKYSTGIYRKKGHLNERAFSYSIRQEHRSRSHSSLATLSFNADTNGHEQSEEERQQLQSIDNNEHSYKNGGGGVKMAANGHHSKTNGASPQQQKMPKHVTNGAKHDSGLSSDSSLGHGGHVPRNGKMAAAPPTSPVKKGGAKNGHRSEMNIKDLSLSDDGQIHDEFPTLKAKNKQTKKMATNSKNLKMANNNNNNTNNKKR